MDLWSGRMAATRVGVWTDLHVPLENRGKRGLAVDLRGEGRGASIPLRYPNACNVITTSKIHAPLRGWTHNGTLPSKYTHAQQRVRIMYN